MTAKDNTLDDLSNKFKGIINSEGLDDWRCSGKPLKMPEDIFNDGIDYTLNTYADVIYLNDQILKVGSKISDCLVDCPRSIKNLSILIGNAICLHSAIKELHVIVADVKNSHSLPMQYDTMDTGTSNNIQVTNDLSTEDSKHSSKIPSVQSEIKTLKAFMKTLEE
eukprot:14936593-Ditylum_brightwellii.AAC.1